MPLAALLLALFTFVPFANLLFARRFAPWYPSIVLYWIVIGGGVVLLLEIIARWRPVEIESVQHRLAGLIMRPSTRAYITIASAFALIAAAAVFVVCFSRQPDDADQAALLWHAKILLSGRLSLPLDPNPEFFGMADMVTVGRWYSMYPVGVPALLAIGQTARAAWLVGPVLVALTVVAVYQFTRHAYGEAPARLAAAMLALSPFVMLMGASFASYVPAACLATIALVQLARWADGSVARALHASAAWLGLALGLMVMVRPLDAVALVVVIGAFQVSNLRREWSRATSLLTQAAVGAIPVAIQLYVNLRTTGAPLRFGYDVFFGGAPQFGFGPDPLGVMHTPARGLAIISKYLLELNASLLAWPVPVFAIIVAGLVRMRRPERWDWLLLAWIGVHCVIYSVYMFEGWFRGPRYLFTVVPAVIILAARSLTELAHTMAPSRRAATLLLVPACLAVTWFLAGTRASLAGINLRQQSLPRDQRIVPGEIASRHSLRNALVFVNQDSRNRTLFRLWNVGFPHGDAVRLLESAPTCALNLATDAEGARAGRPARARIAWLVDEASRISQLVPQPAECERDAARDSAGTALYTAFFAANEIDANGRVAGDVIYVTDLGEQNERLRARFGGRTWYRFGPRAPGSPVANALSRYESTPP